MSQKLPPTPCIAVDVDGTLIVNGVPNTRLVEWCAAQRQRGLEMILWSARGRAHALHVAQHIGCQHLFDAVVSKPGYLVDDKGWTWIQYTHVVRTLDQGAGL
jgi:predicted mannosyl-3-phosphoglycerate phosphatase (HAD superfamily)